MNEESSYCSRCKSYHAITMFINPKKGKLMKTCAACRYSKSFDYYFKKHLRIIQSQTLAVKEQATQPIPAKYVLGSTPVYFNGELFYKP